MKLPQEHRDVIEELLAEAHAEADTSRGIAKAFVAKVRDLDRFGQPWVDDYLDDLATQGAMVAGRAWRRRFTLAGRTRKGSAVLHPQYVGVGGRQLPLVGLSYDDLMAHRDQLAAQRNTLSGLVSFIDGLLVDMEAHRLPTVEAVIAWRERSAA